MKRENEDDTSEKIDSDKQEPPKQAKHETSLELNDLGAGYDPEDKRVARAINIYEKELLPFVEENRSIFKKSNFLAIKGYATGVSTSQSSGNST